MKKPIIRDDFEGFDVHKRFDVIIDLLYTGDNFELGGKLNAIFGQYGISDADVFLDYVNFTFNSILIDLDEVDFSEEKKYDFVFAGFNQNNFEYDKSDIAGDDLNEENELSNNAQFNDQNDIAEQDSIEDKNQEFIEDELQNNENEADQSDEQESDYHEFSINELDPAIIEQHVVKFNSMAESFDADNVVDNYEFITKKNTQFLDRDEPNFYEPIKFDKYLLGNYSNYEKNNVSNFEYDSDESEHNEVSEDEDTITFFVPTILVCYRKEKKADFFIFNPFYKKCFVNLWKLNTLSQFTILNNYKDFFFNLKNFYSVRKYSYHLNAFNKQFFGLNFLNSIVNYTQIPITDKIFESYYDYDFNMYFMYWKKAKLRRKIFRSYYLRKRKQIASFLKSFKWFSYEILFKFFTFRYVFFDLKSDYNELKKKILTLYSIMHAFKKKFARKYRRRKSFKRLVFRNRIGIKMSFIRQQFFEKKKKKK